MGEYVWRTYSQVEREARHFGAGLRALGCAPRQNVVMFAETRAEWMVAAHGCFTQTIPGAHTRPAPAAAATSLSNDDALTSLAV